MLQDVYPANADAWLKRNNPPLAWRTIDTLMTLFASGERPHRPNGKMWDALRGVATTLEDMANDAASPEIFVSSLDPGIGKTQTLLSFLRHMVASPEHQHVGALVCVSRLDEIRSLTTQCGLPEEAYACLTSDRDDLNQLGCGEPNSARVLFTTHARVTKCSRGRAFDEIEALYFRDQPRQVKVWDESILPGRPVTILRDEIFSVFQEAANVSREFQNALEGLTDTLKASKDGDIITMPDWLDEHGGSLQVALGKAVGQERGGVIRKQSATFEKLMFLSGRDVTVRRDGGKFGATVLDYREDLPEGIAPLLVLDASARVRETYVQWKEGRGGLTDLPSAPKNYDRLTVHLWRRGGGKSTWLRDWEAMTSAVAAKIDAIPADKQILVVHHKDCGNGIDFERVIRNRVKGDPGRLSFTHWGAHDSTNKFSHISEVILAGTLFHRPSQYEALGRLASGHPSSEGPFPKDRTKDITLGETRHVVLQALCRGTVRKCDGDQAHAMNAYVIADVKSGLPKSLANIFPGCRVVPWEPVRPKLETKAQTAFGLIKAYFDERKGDLLAVLKFKDIQDTLGLNRQNFKRLRSNPEFLDRLAYAGICEDTISTKTYVTGWRWIG